MINTSTHETPKETKEEPRPLILVIEDDKDTRELIALICEEAGTTAIPVATGKEGIKMAGNESIRLAIIDINLPDMDGYEIVRQLKQSKENSSIKMLALSGKFAAGEEENGRPTGFDRGMTKPFNPQDLMDAIREMSGAK